MIEYEINHSYLSNVYVQDDINLNFYEHLHYSFEFVTVLEGELTVNLNKKEYVLKKGEGMLILPNQIHSYKTLNFSKSKLIIFNCDLIPHYRNYIYNQTFVDPVIHFDNYELLDLIAKEPNNYLKKGYTYTLIGIIDSQVKTQKTEIYNSEIISVILKYIQNNYTKNITLKNIAKTYGYSYNYLSSFFNQYFGVNFSKFVNFYRIDQAVYLLKNTDYSISQIALECGFTTIRSFNREFLSQRKMTPKQYRLMKNNQY